MLYLHCGWPKTGTTSLQAVLARNQEELGTAGFVYPDVWQGRGGMDDLSHNGVAGILRPSGSSQPDLGEFRALLERHADQHLLLSSETLSAFLVDDSAHRLLLSLVGAAREFTEVTCIWSMRRIDDLLASIYLQRAWAGMPQPDPTTFMSEFPMAGLFSGMRKIEDTVDRVVYIKYDADGAHHAQLVRTLEMPVPVSDLVLADLNSSERLNRARTHKETAAMVNADVLAEKAGVALTTDELREVFDQDRFFFTDDRRCVVGALDVRRRIHEQMLCAASESRMDSYVQFFGQTDVGAMPPETLLGVDALTNDDLKRFLDYLYGHLPVSNVTLN